MVQCVPVHGGHVALVDDEDFEAVSKLKWYLYNGYAVTTYHRKGCSRSDPNRNVNVDMHKMILPVGEGLRVDHRNRNRLDNRRGNLRPATHVQNVWNSRHALGESGYIGVRQESKNVFGARIGGASVGFYDSALKAAQARDLEAIKLHGDFAMLNFKREDLPSSVKALPPRNIGERTSTVTGVSYAAKQKRKDKWRVVVRKKHLGWYATEELAIQAKVDYENKVSN